MQIYEYRCRDCGVTVTSFERGDVLGPCDSVFRDLERDEEWGCEGTFRRVFAVNVNRPMQEHLNRYVNAPVSSQRQFEDILKKRSDEAEASTGIPCRYAPVDPRDLIKEVPAAEPPKPVKPHTRTYVPNPSAGIASVKSTA